jgi:spoIIIJ-associated protein
MASEAAEYVQEILEEIADALDIETEVQVSETDDVITAVFTGEDVASLIGHHGAMLDAVQHLAHRIAFHGERERKVLVVDAAGYRDRRAEKLHGLADQAAEAAVRDGRNVKMEAMSSQERKVVHEHLKERQDIETFSEGQEPNRRLVIAPLGA